MSVRCPPVRPQHCRDALWTRGALRRLLLTTSQNFAFIKSDFLPALNSPVDAAALRPHGREWRALEWQHATLEQFTGSGILLDDDQTYDARIRFLDVSV